MEKYIVVFGGCGWDATYKQKEDLSYSDIADVELPGGKGANQAVAAARAGYKVKMISVVGDDEVGYKTLKNLEDNGVDVSAVKIKQGVKSDSCKIFVSLDGANDIHRNKEAIQKFNVELIEEYADLIKNAECVITQSKVPKEVYLVLIDFCYQNGVKTVLTPCPSKDLKVSQEGNLELLRKVTYITANEEEAKDISESESIQEALSVLPNMIVTAGAEGVYFVNDGKMENVSAMKPAKIVDTTGAGDTFCGNFVVSLLKGCTITDSVKKGVKASTKKLEFVGAQPGMPYEKEMEL